MKHGVATLAVGLLLVEAAGAEAGRAPVRLSRLEGMPFAAPFGLTPDGDRLFFGAYDAPPPGGDCCTPRLWVTKGTAASTHRIVLNGVTPHAVILTPVGVLGNRVFVVTRSEQGNTYPLYAHDLATSRTEFLAELGSVPVVAATSDALYLLAEVPRSAEYSLTLYRSDGTRRGTRRVRRGGVGYPMASLRDYAVYTAPVPGYDTATLGVGLFSSGREGERRLLNPAGVGQPFVAGDLAFLTRTTDGQTELWRTDGTTAGTRFVATLPTYPSEMASCGGRLLFVSGFHPGDRDLWVSDGTPGGTALVDALPSSPSAFVPLRTADDGSTCFLSFGSGLWKTDLTPGSLRLISAVNPVDELAGARGRAFFPARDDDHGLEPWTSDGTDDGTRILGDLWPEAEDSRPREFTRSGGRVFFGASRGSEILDADLWVIEVPPGLVIEDVSVTQGPGRMIPAVFKVRLSHRSNDPVTVDFETEAGTAEAGRDFMPSSGVLRFAPGETLKTIRVITRGDEALDGSREFRVRLENPTNGDLDRAVATGTIRPPKARLSGLQHRSAR